MTEGLTVVSDGGSPFDCNLRQVSNTDQRAGMWTNTHRLVAIHFEILAFWCGAVLENVIHAADRARVPFGLTMIQTANVANRYSITREWRARSLWRF
jgi:hypothetical protein